MPSKWFLIFCFSLTTTTVTLASETILNLGNLRQGFRKGVERAKEENPYFFTNSKYVVVFELSVNILQIWTTIWTSLNKLLTDGSYLISYLFNEIVWLLKQKTVPHISPLPSAPPTSSAQGWIKLVVGIQCKLERSGEFPFLFIHSQCKGQDLTLLHKGSDAQEARFRLSFSHFSKYYVFNAQVCIRHQHYLASLRGHLNPNKIIQDALEAILLNSILWVFFVIRALYPSTLQEFLNYWDQAWSTSNNHLNIKH